jgi:carbon storage regulator
MLVMARKPGEAIAIGEQVVIRVIEVSGGQVRLGIEAPREIKIRGLEPDAAATPRPK